jgi:hypothetical protein
MFTSYFANLKNITNPLSISAKSPTWYTGPEFKILAPKYETLMAIKNGSIDEIEYVKQYYETVLDKLNPLQIYNQIIEQYGDDVSLLCYERRGEFCHRQLVSYWFFENLGIDIKEL